MGRCAVIGCDHDGIIEAKEWPVAPTNGKMICERHAKPYEVHAALTRTCDGGCHGERDGWGGDYWFLPVGEPGKIAVCYDGGLMATAVPAKFCPGCGGRLTAGDDHE